MADLQGAEQGLKEGGRKVEWGRGNGRPVDGPGSGVEQESGWILTSFQGSVHGLQGAVLAISLVHVQAGP